ncbi:amidohydrolase family protein [Patescibacteria group bacterium]|nr:amidohydrolase family protein [Patescibacteria group bacterium]MBU2219728.1 amidohydrolase family protein [Patescibacteria group bacterium]MBU2264994.1 amidohydrolase family protein [Patescibacteria group bacterium]
MKIIDCHTHIEKNAGGEINTAELIVGMGEAKIEKAFIYGGEMFNCSNEDLIKEASRFKKELFPVASISPFSAQKTSLKRIEIWLKDGIIYGLKFYTGYEHFYPADKIIRPYLKLAEKYDRPVIFHSGDTWNKITGAKLKYGHPLNFDDLAVDMPDLKIVIAHLGYPWVIDAAEVVYKNKNVFVDCSGLMYNIPDNDDRKSITKLFNDYFQSGASIEKLLFGTDWSLANQKSYVKLILSIPLSPKQKEQVFYNNASKLFKLE